MRKAFLTKKDEDISEKVMPAKHFILKELWEPFHDIEREKDTVLKANPNSKGKTTLSPGHRKHVHSVQ